MRSRLLCLILLAVAGQTARADLKADPDAGKKLLAEGDALADKGDTTEAVLRYKRAFEQLLPGLRKLPFKAEVRRDVTARADLKNVLLKELDEDKTPAEYRGEELAMKAIGFIPRDLDFKDLMIRAYSEEIGAFYDPKTKTMHLILEPEGGRKLGLLERILGKKGGFDKDENKTTIAHELTHALADQHFDLQAMQKAIRNNDDRDLALSALIEGEATLTMLGAQMDDWDGSKVAKLPAERLGQVFGLMMPLMKFAGGSTLRQAPPILVESMLFPYLRGLVFCARLTNKGGWDALDAAYQTPPESTEQILHPEKYRDQPDPPTVIDLGRLDGVPCGWRPIARNVVGELQAAILLRDHDGAEAAAGWDGDQFVAFEGPGDRLGLVWLTTWDSRDDARQFARAYARFQTSKLAPGTPMPRGPADLVRRDHQGATFAIERRGVDVAIVEGFPAEITGPLLEAAFAASRSISNP